MIPIGSLFSQALGFSAVTLTHPNYYTEPATKDLQIDSKGDCWVDNFVVGHGTYGRAQFPGKTNVAGLDLDAIGMTTPSNNTY